MPVTINGTTGIVNPDGSAGTPSLAGSDTNTGIFFPAADTIAFAEGGAEAMRIDSAGNVGIGTSSPVARLNVSVADGGGVVISNTNDTHTGALSFGDTSANSSGRISYDHSSNALRFDSNGSERARIDSSGNLLVGTTTSSGSGNLIAAGVYNNTTASGANVQVDNTGPGLLRRSTSSIVYKTNVEPIDAAYIANALKFRPVWYRSLCDGDRKDWSWYGLIAEEVGAIDPRLVHWRMLETSVDANGQTVQTPLEKPVAEGVMYDRVVVLALGLIQKQETAIQELTAKLDAAEARIAALEAK